MDEGPTHGENSEDFLYGAVRYIHYCSVIKKNEKNVSPVKFF